MGKAGQRTLPFVGLTALVIAFYGHVLFTDRVLLPGEFLTGFHPFTALATNPDNPWNVLQWDALAQYFPWRSFAHRWLRQGILPLWNPHEFCGVPFLANGQSAILYPLNLLFWMMDPARAFGWSAALHFFLAGCFTFLFARRYGLSVPSAFLSAVTFAFCGWLVAWTLLPTLMNVAIWLPLALLLTERVLERPSLSRAAAFAFVLGLVLLAGHFQIAFYVFLAVALRVVWFVLSRDRSDATHWTLNIGHWALGIVLAVLLASAQLLPTAELARVSHRAGKPTPQGYRDTRNRSALQFAQLANLVSPVRYDVDNRVNPYAEHCGYAGVVPLLLALVGGIVAWRRSAFFSVLAVFALLYAMGVITYPFYFFVPGVSQMGGLGRVLVLWCFGVAMLAGFGLEWTKDWLSRRGSHHLVIAVVALFIIATTADLFNFGRNFNPTSPRALIYPPTELTDFLQRNAQDARILCLTPQWTWNRRPFGILPPNGATVYGLNDAQGYDSLQQRRYKQVMDAIEGAPGKSSPALNGNMILLHNYRSPQLDALAVKYVLSLQLLSDRRLKFRGKQDDVFVYENQAAHPRCAWQLKDAGLAPSSKLDIGKTYRVVSSLEGGAAPLKPSISPQSISLNAAVPQDGVIKLADSSFPGWRASVDGGASQMKSEAVQRSVAVKRGQQKAQFVYFPTSFRVGLFLSGVAVCLLTAMIQYRHVLPSRQSL